MEFDFVKWIGHASFMLESKDGIVYVDPFKLSGNFAAADIVFITHSHFDHLSTADIDKIAGKKTIVVAPSESRQKLPNYNVFAVEPGKEYEVNGIKFSTVPAYNIKKERLGYHPRANNWVGYIIGIGGKRIYHAGDTDFVEEMKSIDCDLALLPIGGTYTMDIDEAIEASKGIKARFFAPMHYKALLGADASKKAEERFSASIDNSLIFREVQDPSYSF
ncbi:MAG: MBL fold metallo-hydrolase [Candidatus Micrarchaeia archaeon]